ncbi:alpha/beta hydrolase [Vibrio phage VAP7]|uniref:Alpha/beta hydrolase n=1 Tax=Vibrio phage VAP7 TaxID=2584487 RepID=A0A4Y5TV87_9CAUD|nr:alpha/beta hydrolase [Vibrio phage VAP7]QDB73271.1 alpha/beta hydrolase [Vibrio phage VAP7]UFD98044.1 hypothetical protein [Vibrio phage BX-1]
MKDFKFKLKCFIANLNFFGEQHRLNNSERALFDLYRNKTCTISHLELQAWKNGVVIEGQACSKHNAALINNEFWLVTFRVNRLKRVAMVKACHVDKNGVIDEKFIDINGKAMNILSFAAQDVMYDLIEDRFKLAKKARMLKKLNTNRKVLDTHLENIARQEHA